MVTVENNSFYIDGKKIQLMCGAIHYFRTFPEQWRDRLRKLKAIGFNTVETYCAWNLHEPKEGEFNFDGMLDIERFIKTAEEEGLYVIVRPGPYICSEWDFGGLPAWLLKYEGIQMRSCDPIYFEKASRFVKKVMEKVVPHLQTNGGNVILIAVENEYGSFSNSKKYMHDCTQVMIDCGVDVPLFTADGHTAISLNGGAVDGVVAGINFGDGGGVRDEHVEWVKKNRPNDPIFRVEHWIGGTMRWNTPVPRHKDEVIAAEVRQQLNEDINFNIYMFHSGTNFGFMNGANAFTHDPSNRMKAKYFSICTTYANNAMLTENGSVTSKYMAVAEVMSEHFGKKLEIPEDAPTQTIGEVELNKSVSLFDSLSSIGTRFTDEFARNMEYYGQDYGYILYRTHIAPNQKLKWIGFKDLFDRTHVYFNGIERGIICRNDEKQYIENADWLNEGGVLELLVENQGRVNFGPEVLYGDKKGLCGYVCVCDYVGVKQILSDWEIFTLPMTDLDKLSYTGNAHIPAFFTGTFEAKEKKDCYVHLDNFTKGFVTVNGFNLGRYWKIGPQFSLYLPAPLLRDKNEITVFEEEACKKPVISILDYHNLGDNSNTVKAKPTLN